MDALLLTKDMTEHQRLMFMSEFNQRRKDRMAALLLTLFLGGLGAHRFYLGEIKLGVVYLVFCITLIPAVVAFVELFMIQARVDRYNDRVADELATHIRSVSTTPH
jgi:TM2 domain-containing membrane protein YozV